MKQIVKIIGLPYREQWRWKLQVIFADGKVGHITASKPSILRKRVVSRMWGTK